MFVSLKLNNLHLLAVWHDVDVAIHSRHYAQGLMSQSLPADDSVFHATPVSIHANSSYTNQLYMESKEASGMAPSSQPATQVFDQSYTDYYKRDISGHTLSSPKSL